MWKWLKSTLNRWKFSSNTSKCWKKQWTFCVNTFQIFYLAQTFFSLSLTLSQESELNCRPLGNSGTNDQMKQIFFSPSVFEESNIPKPWALEAQLMSYFQTVGPPIQTQTNRHTHTNKTWKQKTSLCPSASLQAFQALVFRHHRHRRKVRPNGKQRPAMTSPEKNGMTLIFPGLTTNAPQIKSLLFAVTFPFPSSLREISSSFLRRPWQAILPPKQKAK